VWKFFSFLSINHYGCCRVLKRRNYGTEASKGKLLRCSVSLHPFTDRLGLQEAEHVSFSIDARNFPSDPLSHFVNLTVDSNRNLRDSRRFIEDWKNKKNKILRDNKFVGNIFFGLQTIEDLAPSGVEDVSTAKASRSLCTATSSPGKPNTI